MIDSVSDLLAQIKNGYLARRKVVVLPHSKMKESVSEVLKRNNYLESIEVRTSEKGFKELALTLKYDSGTPSISDVKRVSKPGLRVYSTKNKLPRVLSGLGIAIVSTSQGVMTDKDARKKGIGGELIARVW